MDVARVMIPGGSTHSLICQWQTPFVSYAFSNPSGTYQPNARLMITPTYTIQNAALNDPKLIDPNTGEPFNGSFQVSLVSLRTARSLQPNEFQSLRENTTRVCDAGLVSKQALINSYGLSADQAAAFFKNDTVITMDLHGSATWVNFANILYGVRFVGD
jgi:hypothetical protein